MSQMKRASKGKRPSKALSVLGIAGVSWAASAGGSAADIPSQNIAPLQVFTLGDEEISDVSLATFHAFDKENLGIPQSAIQLARGCCGGGCGCGHGCGGGGCGHACGGGCGHACAGGCGHGWVGRGCRGCGVGGCGGCGWGWRRLGLGLGWLLPVVGGLLSLVLDESTNYVDGRRSSELDLTKLDPAIVIARAGHAYSRATSGVANPVKKR